MDQDGSLHISFNEWRDFLLLAPSDNILDIIKYWRHSTVSLTLLLNLSCRAVSKISLSSKQNPEVDLSRVFQNYLLFTAAYWFIDIFQSHNVIKCYTSAYSFMEIPKLLLFLSRIPRNWPWLHQWHHENGKRVLAAIEQLISRAKRKEKTLAMC